jgi:ProP effector
MTMTDEINRLLACLQERFPAAFPADLRACRPLKVGIREDIISELAGEFPPRSIHVALAKHTGRRVYLRALVTGAPRIDLTGQPAGEVSPEQARHAQETLKARREKEKRRQAAAMKPAEARTAPTPAVDIPPVPAHVPSRPILSLKRKHGA